MTTPELPVRIPKTVGLLVICIKGVIAGLLITLITMNAPAHPNTLPGCPQPAAQALLAAPTATPRAAMGLMPCHSIGEAWHHLDGNDDVAVSLRPARDHAAPSRISSPGNVWLAGSGAYRPEMPERVSALGRMK